MPAFCCSFLLDHFLLADAAAEADLPGVGRSSV
jgi:hypothetical protein